MAKRIIATALTLVLAGSPICACINDRDTIQQERQFKSLYPDDATPQTTPDAGAPRLLAYGGSGLGVLLLGAAIGLTRRHG